MTKIKSDDWRNLPIEQWNVKTYHAYLIDRNRELYGVEYQPFGKGPVSQRWRMEQGQIKRAYEKYGRAVIRRYIDECFASHTFNPKFPTLAFGFCWAYKRTELTKAEREVAKAAVRTEMGERSGIGRKVDEGLTKDGEEEWF